MSSVIERGYDEDGNEVYVKSVIALFGSDSLSNEYWSEYDSRGNEIHYRTSYGYESWCEYDYENGNMHWFNSEGDEGWEKLDAHGNVIYEYSADYEAWIEFEYYKDTDLVLSRTVYNPI